MLGIFRLLIIAVGSVWVLISPAVAALDSVSGPPDLNGQLTPIQAVDDPLQVAYSLANGFPIWYQDDHGVKLQLCLDQAVEKTPASGGGTFFPCFLEANPSAPVSFPNNFGPEAFWWAATAATTFTSSDGSLNSMAFTAAQEAAFSLDLGAFDGDQIAFNRIRLRITVPRPGIYRVTHPYGTFDYHLVDAGRRAIDQTQDIGNLPPANSGPPPSGDFTLALGDGEPPQPGFDPSLDNGVIDILGRGIGPFLFVAEESGGTPLPLVESVTGDLYLSDPGDVIHNELPITRGPVANTFRLELISLLELDTDPESLTFGQLLEINPQDRGFFLNSAGAGSQIVEVTDFQIMGKLFRDLPNQAPTAVDDFVGVRKGQSVDIDVVANDLDALGPDNEYTINPQALGLPTDPTNLLAEIKLARRMDLESGAKVQRFTNIGTGRSYYGYDPPSADFTGIDSFWYVVQDHGGLISEPALVEVLVEDLTLDKAEYRPRLGKWLVEGKSSYTGDEVRGPNFVNIYGGPRTQLSPLPGVTTVSKGRMDLRLTEAGIDYALVVDPLPAFPVTSITLRLGGSSGDALMEIFFSVVHGPFNGKLAGTLTPAQSLFPFAEVLEAIAAGNAYVRVDTASRPLGELQGRLLRSVIAENVAVLPPEGEETMGRWIFDGKSTISPGLLPHVEVVSRFGVSAEPLPLRLR